VGLVMGANSRFKKFTQAQYDALFAELVAGSVVIPFDLTKSEKEDELVAANVNLVVIGGTAE
ncbi:MAG: hypothetical protein PHX62_08260, partial [Bacilli bacterium]|nr:hypothetical protein [Bacilli bacterium]